MSAWNPPTRHLWRKPSQLESMLQFFMDFDISLSDQIDTATSLANLHLRPWRGTGAGWAAECSRRGKRIGRPHIDVDAAKVRELQAAAAS